MGEIMEYIGISVILGVFIVAAIGALATVIWGIDAMKDEAKRGSNEPGHYWDHLDGDDDE